MRKSHIALALVLVTFMIVSVCYALTWHTANQVTVAWNAVEPIEGSVIKYKLYLKNAVTGGGGVEIGETEETNFMITLNTEGKFYPGVRTMRYDADGTTFLNQSDIAWSDDPTYTVDPEGFGVQYFEPPPMVSGMTRQ